MNQSPDPWQIKDLKKGFFLRMKKKKKIVGDFLLGTVDSI